MRTPSRKASGTSKRLRSVFQEFPNSSTLFLGRIGFTLFAHPASPTHRFLALLRLIRLPNLFTAAADVLLGYWLVTPRGPLEFSQPLALVMVASLMLYASGMVWNDIFDLEEDRRERPQRPLPSGDVPLRLALPLGTGLMVAAAALALSVSAASLLVTLALIGAIFLYNGVLKLTPLAPVAMGLCRFLNVVLGMAPALWTDQGILATPAWVWGVPLANGVYVAGITLFARSEAREVRPVDLAFGTLILALGLGLHTIILTFVLHAKLNAQILIIVLTTTVFLRAGMALMDRTPEAVQQGVRFMILGLIVIAAIYGLVLQSTAHGWLAILLLLPGMYLGRWIAAS